jgi:glycine dehydrogenase subunit 1
MTMRYIPTTPQQKEAMLEAIGVASFQPLIETIPEAVRLKGALAIPPALSESELEEHLLSLSRKNRESDNQKPLIGAGAYRHFIPEAVRSLLQREEFWTCYTPYQPELSQGTLQSVFEYQSYLSRLTGMEVVIPSIYDGASATAEAALMALRLTHKNKVLVASLLHPHYRETLLTYLAPHGTEIVDIPFTEGLTDQKALQSALDEETAAVIIQSPNFFGGIEDLAALAGQIREKKALFISVNTESISLALLSTPGENGVDIAVGNSQSFGMDLDFGGPYNAYLATRKKYLRQLPGRIVGETVDQGGKRAFVMTLRAREQDIRREKATSNICTNHNLNVTAANIFLSLLGTEGLYETALLNTRMAHYLEERLLASGAFEKVFSYPFYNEFLLRSKTEPALLKKRLLDAGFIPPLALADFYPQEAFQNTWLFAVTEIFDRKSLDRVVQTLSEGGQ